MLREGKTVDDLPAPTVDTSKRVLVVFNLVQAFYGGYNRKNSTAKFIVHSVGRFLENLQREKEESPDKLVPFEGNPTLKRNSLLTIVASEQ